MESSIISFSMCYTLSLIDMMYAFRISMMYATVNFIDLTDMAFHLMLPSVSLNAMYATLYASFTWWCDDIINYDTMCTTHAVDLWWCVLMLLICGDACYTCTCYNSLIYATHAHWENVYRNYLYLNVCLFIHLSISLPFNFLQGRIKQNACNAWGVSRCFTTG